MSTHQNAVNVFISYDQNDEALLQELEKHLSVLKWQGLISIWHHRQIIPGSNRAEAMNEQLQQASIILLLVSADFLASDYYDQILERQKAGTTRIVPIIVCPCDWKNSPLAHLAVLPDTEKPLTEWRNRDAAFSNIVAGIRRIVEGKQLNVPKILQENHQPFASEKVFSPTSGTNKYVLGILPPFKAPIGRDRLLFMLKQQLMDQNDNSPIVVLHGQAGVGKTTLAVELAYNDEIRAFFSGGVLWASFGQKPSLDDILTLWASQLGIDLSRAKTLLEKIGHIQYKLGNAPFLLIIDDLWTLEPALNSLLKVAGLGCASLITTRKSNVAHDLVSLVKGEVVAVDNLDEEAALTLLMRICQDKLTDRGVLVPLAKSAGGLPLTLELMGAYIYNNLPIASDKLRIQQFLRKTEVHLRLSDSSVDPYRSTLEKVIDLSIEDLPNRRTKYAFFALGVFAPKPGTFSKEAMQRITKADSTILQILYNRNLLSQGSRGRFMLHQSLSDAAKSRLPLNDHAWIRHSNYYQEQIKSAIIEQREIPQKIDWRTLFYDLPQFRVIRPSQHSTPIFSILVNQLAKSVRWLNWLDNLPVSLKNILSHILLTGLTLLRVSGRYTKQKHIEAFLANYQGKLYAEAEARDVALAHYERARELWDILGDRLRLAEVLNNMGKTCYMQAQYRRAIECYHDALNICRTLNDQRGQARILTNIGAVFNMIDREHWALKSLDAALSLYQKVEDDRGEGNTLLSIAMSYHGYGDSEKMHFYLNQALEKHTRAENYIGCARTLTSLGIAYLDLDPNIGQEQDQASLIKAMNYFQQALELQKKYNDRAWQGRTLSRIGQIYAKEGKTSKALEVYLEALSIHQSVDYPAGLSATMSFISDVFRKEGKSIWAQNIADEGEDKHARIDLTFKQKPKL